MTMFDPTVPVSESRVQSEPIRSNFNALNDRTDQLTPKVTAVATSTSDEVGIIVGKADKVYFEDNQFVPFSGDILNLRSTTSGVSIFNNLGGFKEVVVYFTRDSEGVGILGFVEGEETLVRDHSIETAATLINSVDNQRVPDPITGESKTVAQAIIDGDLTGPPLDDAIIICSVLVTNDPNAINPRGAIVSLFEADLIDVRPFVHKVVSTSTIETAVEAAAAGITIKNSQVDTEGKVGVVANNAVSSTTVTLSSPINLFDPAELGYNPVVRFTNVATAADPSGSTSFQTATVTSVLGSDLILATPVTVNAGDLVLRGTFTLDRLTFDIVEELSEVMQRNGSSGVVELTGDTSGTANNTNNVSTKTASQVVDTVDGYNTFAPDIIANTAARHTHSNKALLDTYTQTNADIADAIAKEHTHSNKALLDTYTQTNADIADAIAKEHTHSNKALLDTYTQTNADIADAIAKEHTHSNKALLDTYTQTNADLKNTVDGYNTFAPDIVLNNAHRETSNIHFTEASIDHDNITNSGSNSHSQIDAHISSTSNPHSVTISQIGAASSTHTHTAADVSSGTFSGDYLFGGLLALTPSAVYVDGEEIGVDHPNDKVFIRFDSTDLGNPGDPSLSLPSSPTTGQILIIKDTTASSQWRILGNGNNIDGVGSLTTINVGSAVRLIYDGAEWWII